MTRDGDNKEQRETSGPNKRKLNVAELCKRNEQEQLARRLSL